ncbi:hypothetical protein QOT17_014651 [Balamuthia mandrillaris]
MANAHSAIDERTRPNVRRYAWLVFAALVSVALGAFWYSSGPSNTVIEGRSSFDAEVVERLRFHNQELQEEVNRLRAEVQQKDEAVQEPLRQPQAQERPHDQPYQAAPTTTQDNECEETKNDCSRKYCDHITFNANHFGSQLQLERELPGLTRGVITLAQGPKSVEWVTGLVTSLHKHHPDMNITLNTDEATYPALKERMDWYMKHSSCSQGVTGHLNLVQLPPLNGSYVQARGSLPSRAEKISTIQHSPYNLTMFLDADVFLCRPGLNQLWFLLQQYDVAASITRGQYKPNNARPNVPDSFYELNSGVMLYRKNENTMRMINKWKDLLFEKGGMDQGPFREALWTEKIPLYAIPYVYNCRVLKSCSDAPDCFVAHWKSVTEKTQLLRSCGFPSSKTTSH